MKTKLNIILLFSVRFTFTLIILFITLARNMMLHLNTGDIGEVLKLIDKYKSVFSLKQIDEGELLAYKIIYATNEHSLTALILLLIIWITFETILILAKKDRRNINE